MSVVKKQIVIVVTNPSTGDYITTWRNFYFEGFTKELNGGSGECVIILDKAFDYGGYDTMEGNDVEIRITDRDTLSAVAPGDQAKTIYTGYISLVEGDIDGGKESLKIHLLGHYTKLGTDIMKIGSQTTLYSDASAGVGVTSPSASADIGLMMRGIIDTYRSETDNPKISYDSAKIPLTSTMAKHSFEQKTYREAMDTIKSMAPIGTYYYIDPVGRVEFKSVAATPTHKFTFGKHFTKIHFERSLEKTRNFILVWNGETDVGIKVYKAYEDADSVAQYGRRTETMNDYGIDDEDAADVIGAKFIAENKDISLKVTCTIMDNGGDATKGYDIESIEPGDTCSFYGFESDLAEILRDNMIITKVTYALDSVEIEVEIVKSSLVDWQDATSKSLKDVESKSMPETYS